ncbi:hypothetical protein NIES4102_34970 [Chondrocystis sp. NIES-4102]|nr:hypothetical protein NIES4102_34970 [Chondrocystis sp. NIES-4102]
MAFHLFNLGPVAANLQKYADNQGLVPEKGDLWQDFQWTRRTKKIFADQVQGKENWQTFSNQALAATIKAEEALLNLEFPNQ